MPLPVQCAAMKPSDFTYELPEDLIAQEPLARRDDSRLLYVPEQGDYRELRFSEVGELLRPGDLLVLNDTRVVPARLFGQKSSGGGVEMLLERVLEPTLALVQLRASRSPKVGVELVLEPGISATVEGRQGGFFILRFESDIDLILEQHGHVPLPPYINREDDLGDRERYQTVYAREPGAVAAPTAGLHFSEELLEALESAGVEIANITLHVAAGTFAPLRAEQLEGGYLHKERVDVGAGVCSAVERASNRNARVVAVGTTVVRALESAAVSGELQPFSGETDIFIRPGYKFSVVDAMITNFHLPESSLLMLVSAFHGTDAILRAYRFAVDRQFRFFSYGDAMFLERRV